MLLKSAGNARGFEAKVTDFGAARRLAAADRLATNSNDTITHCSPELLLHSTVSEARPASRAAAPPPPRAPPCGSHGGAGLKTNLSSGCVIGPEGRRRCSKRSALPQHAFAAVQ